MISATAVPPSCWRRANAICSSVKCFLPILTGSFLKCQISKNLTSKTDQEMGGRSGIPRGGRTVMGKGSYRLEEIVSKLREAEVVLAQGKTIAQVCKQLGITDQTYY